jgi:integrase
MKKSLQAELQRHAPLTLYDAIARYLDYKKTLVGKEWLAKLADRLRTLLPDVSVNALTPERAEELYLEETKRVGKFGVVKAATHQACLRNVKEFYAWLVKKKLAIGNPFQDVRPIGKANVGKEQPRETDARLLDSLLFAKAREGNEGALALLIQIYLGLRPGEVLDLQVGAVERDGLKVTVKKGKTKNAKRSLDLYPEVAKLLFAHCQGRKEEQRVFAANLEKRPATDWMYKRLHAFCKEAGIRKFCPHSLRGLHSTLALQNGATSYDVAASLGHASFSTTARHYADPAAIDNARVRRVVGVIKGAAPKTLEAELASLSAEERDRILAILRS